MAKANRPKHLLVIGAGVVGLSTAIHLQDQGCSVEIWAEKITPHTTSDIAAALWEPYHVEPEHKVIAWAARTLDVLRAQQRDPGSGVLDLPGSHKWRQPTELPAWTKFVENFRLDPSGAGFTYRATVADMAIYMPWLANRFTANGGKLTGHKVADLNVAAEKFSAIINCTGLGSAKLVSDDQIFPIRGIVLEITPRLVNEVRIDNQNPAGPTYIIPRTNSIICGGCTMEHDANLDVYPGEAEAILSRCAELAPELKQAKEIKTRVGLRPARSAVRLETELLQNGKLLIHNYGHGGAGLTLSWGCAEEVGVILSDFLKNW